MHAEPESVSLATVVTQLAEVDLLELLVDVDGVREVDEDRVVDVVGDRDVVQRPDVSSDAGMFRLPPAQPALRSSSRRRKGYGDDPDDTTVERYIYI